MVDFTLLEGFETIGDWTVEGTDATQEADTTNFKQGVQSLKVNASLSNLAFSTKPVNWSLVSSANFTIWVYVYDLANLNNVAIYFSSVTDWTKFFLATISSGNLQAGWNNLLLPKSLFTNTGGESWDNTMIRFRVRVNPKASVSASVSFDDLNSAGSPMETYGSDEERIYYVAEDTFGVTPSNPSMKSIPADQLEPSINAGNIKLRGAGSYDLQAIKRGLRQVGLKIGYPLPSAAPVELLQWAKMDLNKSLSIQILYHKGTFTGATDIISMLFTGMKFHKVSVSCSIEDIVKAVAEFQGVDATVGTSKISGATYTEHNGAVSFHESYVKKDSTTLDRVTDWKFDIENNVKAVPVIRSSSGYLAKYLPFKQRALSGEVTFEFESIQEANEVLADTEFSLEFGLGGTAKATFSGCKWDGVSIPSKMEDLISLKAPFTSKGPLAISAI